MARNPQLKLVQDSAPAHGVTADPVRQVFEHWVLFFGKHPARCKLDVERAQVIRAAVDLFGQALVMQAVEGMASAPLADKPESMRLAMTEVSWFLAKAVRVERALAHYDKLQEALAEEAAPPAQPAVAGQVLSAEELAAAKARAAQAQALAVATAARLRRASHG